MCQNKKEFLSHPQMNQSSTKNIEYARKIIAGDEKQSNCEFIIQRNQAFQASISRVANTAQIQSYEDKREYGLEFVLECVDGDGLFLR